MPQTPSPYPDSADEMLEDLLATFPKPIDFETSFEELESIHFTNGSVRVLALPTCHRDNPHRQDRTLADRTDRTVNAGGSANPMIPPSSPRKQVTNEAPPYSPVSKP